MQTIGVTGSQPSSGFNPLISMALIFLMPVGILSVYLGSIVIGEEGSAMWRVYSAPISAESLVKSKYSFIVFLSIIVVTLTGIIGVFVFQPSVRAAVFAFVESFLLMFALSAISLAVGMFGPDFREVPRPRMIRPEWSFFNLIVCLLAGVAVLAPFVPYAVSFVGLGTPFDLYQAVIVSVVISVILTFVGYRLALRNARQLLQKAET